MAQPTMALRTVETEAQALELLALPPPTKRVAVSSLAPGGRAPGADIQFGPDGDFQAVVLAAGSLVPSADDEEGKVRRRKRRRWQEQHVPAAQEDATRRAVLLQLAFLFMHCLVAMAAFCWEPSTRDLEQPSVAEAAVREPEPEPEWLASAWVLALGGGAVRVPMPAAVGQALLELIDRNSSANTDLRAALASASSRSRVGQQG
jgi:hypothetical protein